MGDESSADKSVAPLAEALNSPASDAGVVEVPVSSQIDAIIHVSSVSSANRGVVSVLLTDELSKATTLMSLEGYSQLAIMQGKREVRGMITWESIAQRENIRLLERDGVWSRLGLTIYKTEFIKRLLEVRDIRNEVMHFGPDLLDEEQRKSLHQMEQFLRRLFV